MWGNGRSTSSAVKLCIPPSVCDVVSLEVLKDCSCSRVYMQKTCCICLNWHCLHRFSWGITILGFLSVISTQSSVFLSVPACVWNDGLNFFNAVSRTDNDEVYEVKSENAVLPCNNISTYSACTIIGSQMSCKIYGCSNYQWICSNPAVLCWYLTQLY